MHCVTLHVGSQERGGEELLSITDFIDPNLGIAGGTGKHRMTIRLDTEAGKHRVKEGETKLDN